MKKWGWAIFTVIMIGLAFFFFRKHKRQRGQIGFEEQFVQRYRYFWDSQMYLNPQQFIPLTFKDEDVQTLLKICTKYKSIFNPSYTSNKIKVKKFQPKVQTKRLGFRSPNTNSYLPVRVKLIRCTLKYAFIDLGTGFSGFVLEKDKRGNTTGDNELFFIRDEFIYKGKRPYSHLLPASDTNQPFLLQPDGGHPISYNQGQTFHQEYQFPTTPDQTPQQGYQPHGPEAYHRFMQTGDYNWQMETGPPTPVDGSMLYNPALTSGYQQYPAINTYPNVNEGPVATYPPNIQPISPQPFQPPVSLHGHLQTMPVLMPPPQFNVHHQ